MYNVEKDPTKRGLEEITKLERLADKGIVLAQLELGKIYLHGLEIEGDIAKGLNYFNHAAQKGCEEALNHLALICHNYDDFICDEKHVKIWYSIAKQYGYERPTNLFSKLLDNNIYRAKK